MVMAPPRAPGTLGGVTLTRPAPSPDRGPLDDDFYDLVEARFRRTIEADPVGATYLGIHAWDDRLGDASRERLLHEIEADRQHLAAIERVDPAGLSAFARFERDLELHNLRRALFDAEVMRLWERRSSGADAIGDALFPLFTRDFAPPAERFEAIAGRLEAVREHLRQHRTRAAGPQVAVWQRLDLESSRGLGSFFAEIREAAAVLDLDAGLRRRLDRAARTALDGIDEHARWVERSLAAATDDWALGRERYDRLVELRAFDGLDADAILEIGWDQLRLHHEARAEAARALDPDAPVEAVVQRLKDDHPADFTEALEEYRVAMRRARAYLVEHGIVSVPDDERVEVIETPSYMRNVMPFAAYFQPAPFDPRPVGIYVVTPSPDGDADAIREHYRAGISNTSIHEAYPGHHLQLAIAARHPSLTRRQVDAPEFDEGWGMYSEQMMREEGFDDGPAFRIALATDAIWRACRIILDVRMHRGELTIDQATDFLVGETGFERPHALAEVHRYTSTPTYPLSYLLGKVLILELREAERRRLGTRFSLRAFHDALLANGSIPVSFHRRALAGEDRPASGVVAGGAGGRRILDTAAGA